MCSSSMGTQAWPFATGVRRVPDLVPEVALGRFIGHVHALALHIELPAVIYTAQPVLLIPSKEERSALVRTVVPEQTDRAAAIPEGDQILTQEPYTHGRAIGPGEGGGEREHRARIDAPSLSPPSQPSPARREGEQEGYSF